MQFPPDDLAPARGLSQKLKGLTGTRRHYVLKCRTCNRVYDDDGLMLKCSAHHSPSLLISAYKNERFDINTNRKGLFRYETWLPSAQVLSEAGGTVTYRSRRLSALTGLPRLWVAFNGYWPSRGAQFETATFKDLEAYAVLARLPRRSNRVLVVASAGNTGSAFANACSKFKIPCLVIVPDVSLERMSIPRELDSCVKIVSISGRADYNDAIDLAHRCLHEPLFFPEGGVRNVARRDGLGTVLLNAVEVIGRLPDFYFQAIGSGTGGIAVHEAATRIAKDGRFGRALPKLILSQNLPFAPIQASWQKGLRRLVQMPADVRRSQIRRCLAQVLSNAHAPYSVAGGLFDVLTESEGSVLAVDNAETLAALKIFEDSEGVDIDPAAGVAFATLLKCTKFGRIPSDSVVLLNITGGGRRNQTASQRYAVRPSIEIPQERLKERRTTETILRLFP